jgi:hypothetical protein
MFIEKTAVRYGLGISSTRDESLDSEASTTAAMRMLGELGEELDSWDLALLA